MVMRLIAVLRRMNITFYVASYEADAQLAFLSRHKLVDVVISDDSDCVPYGVKTVLFKLNLNGWCSELKRRSLGANEELSFIGWTEEMKLKMLCPLNISKDILQRVDNGLGFLGNVELRDDVVASIASGHIHPLTHESYAWKDTAAAVLLETDIVANHKRNRTRSSTSSESSGIILPRRYQKDAAIAASANTPNDLSQEETISTLSLHRSRTVASRVRYEKPRPSSQSSWTHLDSVLGSSDHIVNFRSPKVSENFRPLAALYEPPTSIRNSSATAQSLKGFESCPVRDHVKRVRNPSNRRRDGKGSGFEGEVLCRVDQGHTSSLGNSTDVRQSTLAGICDSDRMTDEENAPPQQAKRPRVFGHPLPPSSPLSSHISEASSQMLLVRPTPFDCGQGPPIYPTASAGFNWKLPQHHSQQPRSPPPAATNPASNYAYVISAEEKWDRILGDEIDDITNSTGGGVEDQEVSSPLASFAASSSSCRQPLATMNQASRS
ncbi:unnamed protein product [Peronospora destructor]|uniref:Exonuclease 1 n=1 Tax=Peronospora destructor TaxID=86335 RepID=A0AAV0T617_9STRA|nr:unnamed protein product [Peronospora destructor]